MFNLVYALYIQQNLIRGQKMTFNNIKTMKNKDSGFTIVELLIVIVIIGILAALVIVAYTGIQNRARSTQYQTDAISIAKKAEAAAADNNGSYPLVAGDFTGTGALGSTVSIGTALASTAAAPANAAALSTPRAYTIHVCTTGRGGIRVYYPDPATSSTAIKTTDAGTWAANC